MLVSATINSTYQSQHGDDSIENFLNLLFTNVRILERGVAHADDLVQIIFNSFLAFFGCNLSTQTFEISTQFLSLKKHQKFR